MSDKKTHVVNVIGVLKKNGQMANFGEEVNEDQFDNFDERVRGQYLKPIGEFKKEQSQAEKDAEAEEKEAVAAKAAELKERNDLLEKYLAAFKSDAPGDASNEALKKAIDDKKPLIK